MARSHPPTQAHTAAKGYVSLIHPAPSPLAHSFTHALSHSPAFSSATFWSHHPSPNICNPSLRPEHQRLLPFSSSSSSSSATAQRHLPPPPPRAANHIFGKSLLSQGEPHLWRTLFKGKGLLCCKFTIYFFCHRCSSNLCNKQTRAASTECGLEARPRPSPRQTTTVVECSGHN